LRRAVFTKGLDFKKDFLPERESWKKAAEKKEAKEGKSFPSFPRELPKDRKKKKAGAIKKILPAEGMPPKAYPSKKLEEKDPQKGEGRKKRSLKEGWLGVWERGEKGCHAYVKFLPGARGRGKIKRLRRGKKEFSCSVRLRKGNLRLGEKG